MKDGVLLLLDKFTGEQQTKSKSRTSFYFFERTSLEQVEAMGVKNTKWAAGHVRTGRTAR